MPYIDDTSWEAVLKAQQDLNDCLVAMKAVVDSMVEDSQEALVGRRCDDCGEIGAWCRCHLQHK